MTSLELADGIRSAAEALLAEIKAGTDVITVSEARTLYSRIREVEGWLHSARLLLEPEGIL
jgi:hypothetical protein